MTNCLMAKLAKYTLRQQLLGLAGVSFTVLLLITLITCIGLLVGTNNSVRSDAEDALVDQIRRNTEKVLEGSSTWFVDKLNAGHEGFLNIYTFADGDTYRLDYSMGFTPSYFDYGDTYLLAPLSQDNRQIKDVSFGASSYYLPGSTPDDIANFSAGIISTRDLSAHIDPFMIPIYGTNDDFVAGYIGFTENGLFRHYPGTGTVDSDPNRTYDPRNRGWYQEAIEAIENPNDMIITSPYRDFFGKGWMVTLSQVVHRFDTSTIVGVAGSDMLIDQIYENINRIQFLDSGKVTLFETTGIVVADREWDLDPDNENQLSYSDLTEPPVSDDLWTEMLEQPTDETVSLEKEIGGEDYLLVIRYLSEYNNRYLMVVFVPRSEVTAPIDPIIDEMKSVNVSTSVSLTIVFLVLSIIVVLVILRAANKITKPLDDMNDGINTMLENIGKEDIMDGVGEVQGGYGTEQQQLGQNFNQMTDKIREWRDEAKVEQNPYYGGGVSGTTHQFIGNYGDHGAYPENAVFMAPSAPDASYNERRQDDEL